MSLNANIEKNDETNNENIKMVLLVLEENDKSTNDNLDNNLLYSCPIDCLNNRIDKYDESQFQNLSNNFAKIHLSASSKKIPTEINNNLQPKFSLSSNNVSNVWGQENELILFNADSKITNFGYLENHHSKTHPSPPYNQMSQMNEETRSIPYYSQSFYPKMSHLQSSAMYLPYDSFSPMYMQQHTNGSNYQNYQYMPGKADYYQQDEQFDSFGNRPHFFSQNNINLEEKKNFNMGGSFKKMTQKKNSLMMKNNVFSSPNGFDRNDNELDLDCDPKSLFEFCKDQLGSRKIQMFFEKGKEEEKETLFLKVENQLLFLIKDVFGNYVVQKMLERGSQKIKEMVYEKMRSNVLDLTFNTYGCRVVQKALEVFNDEPIYQEKIIGELRSNVLKCIQNQNGNHVIQKCFETIQPAKLDFIINEVIENINNLAFHAYGCRVIQKILEYSDFEKTFPILDKLMENNKKLCECQFGNYIMQHIIEKGPSPQKEKVLQTVKAYFVEFSTNKFASNVAEKAVLFGPKEFKRELVHNLLKNSLSDFLKMMKDPYGNYVAQKLYANVDEIGKKEFCVKLSLPEVVYDLRKDNYGKHVLSCLDGFGLNEKK